MADGGTHTTLLVPPESHIREPHNHAGWQGDSALKALTAIPCFRPLVLPQAIAGTSRRLIHAVARRNWLSGPPQSEARTGLAEAPVRGHSCPAMFTVPSTGLCDVARGRVSSHNDRSSHPLATSRLRDPDRGNRRRARKSWPGSEALVRSSVDPPRMVCSGAVHPSPRGRVEREYRQRLLGRYAVPAVDVEVGRRDYAGISGVAAGAAVPGLAGVAS